MSSIKEQIIKALQAITEAKEVNLEFPENEAFGDYSSNVALLNKGLKIEEIVEKINEMGLPVEAEANGRFINFWLKKDVLVDNLMRIVEEKDKYGTGDLLEGKRIMFEYAHPNTHKTFHIGHLRNITTGETLARLYGALGAEVVRVNYQGDIGLHIAKALWGIRKLGFADPVDIKKRAEFLGKAYATGAGAYEKDEKAKEEIHTINGKIYDKSDEGINKLYKETRSWSLDYFGEIYKRVYTKFDRLYFESEVFETGKKIAFEALENGILEKSEGAVIFPGSKYGLHDRVFISSKGVPTYEAKDLGLARLQFSEYNPDKLIHTVGPEQIEYFRVLFKALEYILPETIGREAHVPYGWVRLKEGKMSSRTGNVVLGEDILDQAKANISKNHKVDDEIAEKIAVGAVKYSFLKSSIGQDIAFDLKESISLEGNSGPYLQYTVARINSVLAKKKEDNKDIDRGVEINEEEMTILRTLVRFPEITSSAAINYSPNTLCNYLYDLASKFNSFYNKDKIIGGENEDFRLALASGVGQVLKTGLKLLGIETPERM
jgi:arginyl-tRNA synthetase